jgi:hypothetical protein
MQHSAAFGLHHLALCGTFQNGYTALERADNAAASKWFSIEIEPSSIFSRYK